jgi:hypothetical protein
MRLMAVLMIAGLFSAAGGVAVAQKRLHPSAHPNRPTQSERVVIRFRARETLDGVYRGEARHRPEQPGCDAPRSRAVTAPSKGRVVRLKLLPPSVDGEPDVRQWCVGGYRAKVFFKQTVRCRPSVQCGDSVEIALGSTTFAVVAEPDFAERGRR